MVVEYERQQIASAEEVSLVPFLTHLVEPMLEGLTGATSPKSTTARSWKLICKQFVGGDVLYAHGGIRRQRFRARSAMVIPQLPNLGRGARGQRATGLLNAACASDFEHAVRVDWHWG